MGLKQSHSGLGLGILYLLIRMIIVVAQDHSHLIAGFLWTA